MIKDIIDIFCKDTVIGLTDIDKETALESNEMHIYKNFYADLFQEKYSKYQLKYFDSYSI